LQAHNLEINWERGKVKITRCLLLYRKNIKLKKKKKVKRKKQVIILEKEKIIR